VAHYLVAVILRRSRYSSRSLCSLGCNARPSKGDSPGRPSFEAREACHRAGTGFLRTSAMGCPDFGPDPLARTSG
jgi:hypothetical protein